METKNTAGGHETCLDENGPTPVIVMSLGRSGTHSTWQVMGNLTGMETFAHEYTGVNSKASNKLWKQVGDDSDWIISHMCGKQKKYGDPEEAPDGIVGFNWKPVWEHFKNHPGPKLGLQKVAELAENGGNPRTTIRVVRSRRNLLDVHLSRVKHAHSEQILPDNRVLPPHCHFGSIQCVALHARAAKNLSMPDIESLYTTLHDLFERENSIDRLLEELRVPTVHVSYDKLYYPQNSEEGSLEWNRIFKFLGKRSNFTWNEITESMEHIPSTKRKSHPETVENYEEVEAALRGTDLEMLLRRGSDQENAAAAS
jgi:hypothetical protein